MVRCALHCFGGATSTCSVSAFGSLIHGISHWDRPARGVRNKGVQCFALRHQPPVPRHQPPHCRHCRASAYDGGYAARCCYDPPKSDSGCVQAFPVRPRFCCCDSLRVRPLFGLTLHGTPCCMPSVNHPTVLRVVQAVGVGRCSDAVLRPSQPVCTNTERATVDQSH